MDSLAQNDCSNGDFDFYFNDKDGLLMSVSISPCQKGVQKFASCLVAEVHQALALHKGSHSGWNVILVMQLMMNV